LLCVTLILACLCLLSTSAISIKGHRK
jgi:hypothetical protein